MNETCDRCGPGVSAVYRVDRKGELYLCRHCTNQLWRNCPLKAGTSGSFPIASSQAGIAGIDSSAMRTLAVPCSPPRERRPATHLAAAAAAPSLHNVTGPQEQRCRADIGLTEPARTNSGRPS